MEVLEDIFEEANEVFEHNPWLTYCEPLHRLREFGVPLGEIDVLDEAPLSLEQIRLVCSIMYDLKLIDSMIFFEFNIVY